MESKHNVQQLLQYWRLRRPRTREELAAYVQAFLGWRIPDQRLCGDHDTPMDYLAWTLLGENPHGSQSDPTGGTQRRELFMVCRIINV